MTDHFAEAERILESTRRDDHGLAYVHARLLRAQVHAQLATIQNLRWLNGYDIDELSPTIDTPSVKEQFL